MLGTKMPLGNVLLDGLSVDDLSILRPLLARVNLRQGAVLQTAGDSIEDVYFPIEGMVSLVAQFESGEAIEIAAIGHEGAIGTKVGKHPQLAFASAVVQLPGKAMRMPLMAFQAAAQKRLGITHMATCANDVMIANLQQSAACNGYHSVEARLARWLLQARDHYDSDAMPLTQKFLSQMLGNRRTTVQLAAAAMAAQGAIEYRRGKIYIKNRAALEAMSCECYWAVSRNLRLIEDLAKI